jgi:hypothetical protein
MTEHKPFDELPNEDANRLKTNSDSHSNCLRSRKCVCASRARGVGIGGAGTCRSPLTGPCRNRCFFACFTEPPRARERRPGRHREK